VRLALPQRLLAPALSHADEPRKDDLDSLGFVPPRQHALDTPPLLFTEAVRPAWRGRATAAHLRQGVVCASRPGGRCCPSAHVGASRRSATKALQASHAGGGPYWWRGGISGNPHRSCKEHDYIVSTAGLQPGCCGLIEVDTGISVVRLPQEVSQHGRETQGLTYRLSTGGRPPDDGPTLRRGRTRPELGNQCP